MEKCVWSSAVTKCLRFQIISGADYLTRIVWAFNGKKSKAFQRSKAIQKSKDRKEIIGRFCKGRFWRMCPCSGFWYRRSVFCTLVPVIGGSVIPFFCALVPVFGGPGNIRQKHPCWHPNFCELGQTGACPWDKPAVFCLIPQQNRHFVPFAHGMGGFRPWDDCPARAIRKMSMFRVAQTVSLASRVFVSCQKEGRFDKNGEKDDFAFYPLKTRALLLRPPKTTKVTKMAGVTQAKAWFRKSRVCSSLICVLCLLYFLVLINESS